jgi:hypothetical protein
MTVTTLAAAKEECWTTVADVRPETEDPEMLARKIPIITTVPACAGTTALIAVPPCDAPRATLNDKLLVG